MKSSKKHPLFMFPNAPLKVNLERMGLLLAIVILIGTYMASLTAAGGWIPVPPQRDPLFFLQYARMIAAGEWLVYMPGDAVSTGCTSVIYPVLLAIPLMVCDTPGQMMASSFFLNAILFLGAVYLSVRNARIYFSSREGYGLAFLFLLMTQSAFLYASLGQTDVVLFALLTQGMFWAMLTGHGGWLMGLAAIAPWCRPEGAVLGVAALLTSFCVP